MRRGSLRVERRDLLRSVAILQNGCNLQEASWLGAISLTENDDAREGYSVIGGRVRWPTPTTRRPLKSRGLVPFDRKQDICESGHGFLALPVALQFADQLHPTCRFRIPPRPTSGRICDMARYPAALPEPESKLIDSPLFSLSVTVSCLRTNGPFAAISSRSWRLTFDASKGFPTSLRRHSVFVLSARNHLDRPAAVHLVIVDALRGILGPSCCIQFDFESLVRTHRGSGSP
jgi:hypothetical protein